MIGQTMTDVQKSFIRKHYREFGAKWCAHELQGPSYTTIKRWANGQGLRRQFRGPGRPLEARINMNVAEMELEALNRRAWR